MQQTATILSAELSGLQAVSESLPPDEITSFMGEIHTLVETTARMHHGSLNRFTGDTFLLVFHHNKTSKNAVIHAVDGAIELSEQINSIIKDEKSGQPLSLKIGIASGNILSTEIGSKGNVQQTIMGEAVKHATRICQFAGDGQTIVDGPSHEMVKDHGVFQSLEPIPLKGGAETLPIYELIEKKRRKLDLSTIERKIASEMVGRGREAEQLESLIKKLIAGKGSVVNIVGKAGIGKSRLVAEMKVQPIMENVLLLEGRAMSTGQNLSFHPISNLIKSWAGITEDDVPSVSSEKLYQGIKLNTPEQADEIYSFLATMMGLPLEGKYKERIEGIEGEALEKLILKNLRDLIISAAKDKPRIYLIEDMHWADSSSLTMFESLYKLSQNHPVMFINVMRPGYKETSDYILKYLVDKFPGEHITININQLDESESGNLIKNLLRRTSLPDKIHEMIIRKTEGNPFFIEEIIRSFLDEGIIEVKESNFIVSEKINNVNIPETINEAILSRVDKLDEKTRELLNTASVIGRNFYYKVLEEATDTIEELDERLSYLSEVQLITETKKKEEIEYLFKHALAQQLTYDTIMQQSRKNLHQKIAKSIEKVFIENLHDFFGTLAYHYEMAENFAKTEEYLLKAGEESLRSGAPHEAYKFLHKGLEISSRRPGNKYVSVNQGDYYFKLAQASHSAGMNTEAITYIEKFQQLHNLLYPQKGIKLILGLFWRMINFFLAINFPKYYFKKPPNPLDEAMIKLIIAKGQSMVTITPKKVFIDLIFYSNRLVKLDISRIPMGAGLFMEYSGIFIWTGISKNIGRQMIKIASENISKERKVEWMKLRYDSIMLRLFFGTFIADKNEDEIYELGLKSGAFWETTTYLMFSCYMHIERGNRQITNKTRKRLLETADIFENDHSRVQYHRMSGIAFMKFRLLDEAIENSDQGMDMIAKTGHEAILMLVQCSRILALTLKNQLEEAEYYLQKAEKIAQEKKRGVIFYSTFLVTKAYYLITLIKISAGKSLTDKLMKELLNTTKEAVKYSKKYSGNLTEAYRLRGMAFFNINKGAKALAQYKKAMETGIKSEGNLELSRTYFELGKFLSNPEIKQKQLNGLSGKDYLDKAKAMFEEMDLQWDLGEHRKFVAGQSPRE